MSGYSGTPLSKKLGIKEGGRVLLLGAPENYPDLLDPLPPAVKFVRKIDDAVDIVQLFTVSKSELQAVLADCRKKLRSDAAVWISWPKKTSKLPSEITEDIIRTMALPTGWVDIKVCAINEIWSGLKLVVRKDLR